MCSIYDKKVGRSIPGLKKELFTPKFAHPSLSIPLNSFTSEKKRETPSDSYPRWIRVSLLLTRWISRVIYQHLWWSEEENRLNPYILTVRMRKNPLPCSDDRNGKSLECRPVTTLIHIPKENRENHTTTSTKRYPNSTSSHWHQRRSAGHCPIEPRLETDSLETSPSSGPKMHTVVRGPQRQFLSVKTISLRANHPLPDNSGTSSQLSNYLSMLFLKQAITLEIKANRKSNCSQEQSTSASIGQIDSTTATLYRIKKNHFNRTISWKKHRKNRDYFENYSFGMKNMCILSSVSFAHFITRSFWIVFFPSIPFPVLICRLQRMTARSIDKTQRLIIWK